MKRSLITLALAVSLLFNVFVLAGYLKARAEAQRDADVDALARRVAEELGLDAGQAALFTRHLQGGQQDASLIQDSVALVRREFVEELKGGRDLDRLSEIVEQEHDLKRQWRLREAERLHEFFGTLSPDQCRRAADRMYRGGWGRGDRQRFEERMRQFDADGDGELNEQERQEAKAYMQQRRREHMLERFDRDGDGRLDEQERREAERAMRQRHHERRLRKELQKRFDVDGDGQWSEQEVAALRQWLDNGGRARDHAEGRGERSDRRPSRDF